MTEFNRAMSAQLRAVAGWSRTSKLVLLLVLVTLPLYLGPIMAAIGTVVPLAFFRAGNRYLFRVLDQAGIYVLLALGLNVVVGYAGLLDLGYVAFYAMGAYMAGWFASNQFAKQKLDLGAVGLYPGWSGSPRCGSAASTWRSSRSGSARSSASRS